MTDILKPQWLPQFPEGIRNEYTPRYLGSLVGQLVAGAPFIAIAHEDAGYALAHARTLTEGADPIARGFGEAALGYLPQLVKLGYVDDSIEVA